VSFLHFYRYCARYVCPLAELTIVTAFPPAALPAFYGTTQSSDSLLLNLPSSLYYRLSGILAFLQERTGPPGLPSILNLQHAMLSDPGAACATRLAHAAHAVGFRTCKSVALSHFEHFEAQSLQLTLTACWFAPPVLNLWDYSRQPRVYFPAGG